jgi:MerR family transcriptional regulator, light-induced transcriptional regulator
MTHSDEPCYNIGAVSKLSGVSREKIRIWERRYGAVTPFRDATNHRLYSRHDIERLSLIRKLVDRGHAVSGVANLPLETLQARLHHAGATPTDAPPRALVVAVDDDGICSLLTQAGVAEVARVISLSAADAWLQDDRADLVIVALPTLLSHDLPHLLRLRREAPRARLLVVYRFAARALLEQIRALGMQEVKAPLQPDDLDLAHHTPPHPAGAVPAGGMLDHRARRYDADQLRALAGTADDVKCECPRHLVELVRELCAFEDYSLGCESESPQDSALHREIYDVVARARALVEDALGIVAAEERLE